MPGDLSRIDDAAAAPAFGEWLTSLVLDLCAVDTVPTADLAATAARESAVFDCIEGALARAPMPGARTERLPVDPAIGTHPFYSLPYYTARGDGAAPLEAADAYRGRANLVHRVPGLSPARGTRLALNAHVDVVRPYIAPTADGNLVRGRGACDDKGPLASIVGALALVAEWTRAHDVRLGADLTAMFVIDEETGGNGSLALATDDEVNRWFDTILVAECTGGVVHPANRGAVWYRIEGAMPGGSALEAAAYIYDEVEREGRALKAESRHPLFPHRPVQTCHGVLGGYGEHPSRICARVDIDVMVAPSGPAGLAAALPLVTDVLESGLAEYIALYGDKTQVIDESTGAPKVARHYDLHVAEHGYAVRVYGASGHMGAILVNDGAITKMAAMVRALVTSRAQLGAALGGSVRVALHGWDDQDRLLAEGGQGFLPTHALGEVQARISEAVQRGVDRYRRLPGQADGPAPRVDVTFNKLHNAAFAGPADSPAMRHAIEAARGAGTWDGADIRGWDVSCDARLFACERPYTTVLTAGPGELKHAHSDQEQIDVRDVARFAAFLARFILLHTGTATSEASGAAGG